VVLANLFAGVVRLLSTEDEGEKKQKSGPGGHPITEEEVTQVSVNPLGNADRSASWRTR